VIVILQDLTAIFLKLDVLFSVSESYCQKNVASKYQLVEAWFSLKIAFETPQKSDHLVACYVFRSCRGRSALPALILQKVSGWAAWGEFKGI